MLRDIIKFYNGITMGLLEVSLVGCLMQLLDGH
jgi:hypothetical protein